MSRHRRFVDPILLGSGYGICACLSIALTRFDGGVAFLWVATSLLLAWLSTTAVAKRGPVLASCTIAGMVATAWLGFGPAAAPILGPLSVAEAWLGLTLLRKWLGHSAYFESTEGIAAFVVVAGVVSPAITGIPGALIASLVAHVPFGPAWFHWCAGHGLGAITFTPIFMLMMRGEVGAWSATHDHRGFVEPVALLTLVAAIIVAVFHQSTMPLLFLPLLPMMVATVRLGRLGAAGSIFLVAVIGGVATLLGEGPVHLLHATNGARTQFFQLYVATAALLVLPVAALLNQRKALMIRLSESEARHALIARHTGDAILNVSIDGTILYASPAFRDLGGFDPDALIGRNALELVGNEDKARVIDAHREALRVPERSISVEYRAPLPDGQIKWFESNCRAVIDETGTSVGVVSAIRDVSQRKALENNLRDEASRDPLTGLLNRRAFFSLLDDRWREVGELGLPCSIAMLDIDHFKLVNDRYGHAVGDLVLQAVANAAQAVLRDADVMARIGGEEFALILRNADAHGAAIVAERLRKAIGAIAIRPDGIELLTVTVSVGVAELKVATGPAETLQAADAALYKAKAEGRNCLRLVA